MNLRRRDMDTAPFETAIHRDQESVAGKPIADKRSLAAKPVSIALLWLELVVLAQASVGLAPAGPQPVSPTGLLEIGLAAQK